METTSEMQPVSLEKGAAIWARLTGVPRPHRATLLRWATKGVKGYRLRAERLAGRWYTTPAAIEEFLRKASQPGDQADASPAGPARSAQVQRTIDALDRKIAPRRRGRPSAK